MGVVEKHLAKQAITEVIYRYCRAMDRLDAELGYSIWDEGAEVDYGLLYTGSGRGFIDWANHFHNDWVATSHQVANILIQVNDDGTAGSEAYVTATMYNEEGAANVGMGRYLDQWICRDGEWLITHRDFALDIVQVAAINVPVHGWGARDRTDKSYVMLSRLPA